MCLISDQHKFVFLHNPKCGGSSVRAVLDSYCNIKYTHHYKDRDVYQHKFWYHEPASAIRAYFARWAKYNYFAFGLIRNPWDRMVSWYTYGGWSKDYIPKGIAKQSDGTYTPIDLFHVDNKHLVFKKPEISFDDFIETCYDTIITSRNKFIHKRIMVSGKQFEAVGDSKVLLEDRFWPCRLIYPSLANNFFVDNKGNYCVKAFKLEDLGCLTRYIYERVGIKVGIPHLNKSERNDSYHSYHSYYNKKSARMVEEIYNSDIELGKYQF